MSGSYPGNLRVWEAWNLMDTLEHSVNGGPRLVNPLFVPDTHTEQLYLRETLRGSAQRIRPEELADPFTLHWFLHLETQRHRRYAKWLPRVLEFTKHAGETLLGLGTGLGTDWAQYAKEGASVVVCGPSAEELALVRLNFDLRRLPGRFLHANPAALPLESATIDVACVGSLDFEQTEPAAVMEEIHRVLKPGGKVLFLAPAQFNIHYWMKRLFPWQDWLRGAAPASARAERFTARQLRTLFGRFTELRIHKRHLRRAEVPHLWRWVPLPMLERWVGHFLILKAFKPLSAALSLNAAA